ncbi:putative ammonium transporter 2 [Acanthaster planci]|uniref:Ammonium transporter n=1 Tax=Acanthaster planci TaxID=133434 RepID=A0A8B7ZHU3_ACAPL|nr:putative ammonium transporter 2 [Acanthaster planci]
MEATASAMCNGTVTNGTEGCDEGLNGTQVGTTAARTTMNPDIYNSWDDATWILTSAFVIFTMQSGFGLLESGMVSRRNEVNIMVKNAVDVIFGGLTYWIFGYGFSFGTGQGTNAFCGIGHFFTDSTDPDEMGWIFAKFVFQASFATTATTIVSGAMAERTKLEAYCVFSLVNTLIYCFPAHWIWSEEGVFARMGAIDIAGAGAVHLVGGATGLVATLMLKPRRGRFDGKGEAEMSNPTNALLGMFMLWWGWLGFNCGSTFGISGGKWKLATRSAMVTITSSIGGGVTGLAFSWTTLNRTFNINYLINGVLGALVGSTAICALSKPWEGLVIGAVGGVIAVATPTLLERLKIDDPVGVIGVHLLAAIWGLAAVGLFGKPDHIENLTDQAGLFYGGGFRLLGVQLLMAVTMLIWTCITAYILLFAISKTIGLRCSVEHEILGADICEHGINQLGPDERVAITKELQDLGFESPFDCPSPRVRLRSASSRRRSYTTRGPSVAAVTGTVKSMEAADQVNGVAITHLTPDAGPDRTELDVTGHNWILMERANNETSNGLPQPDEVTLSVSGLPKPDRLIGELHLGTDNPAFDAAGSRPTSPFNVSPDPGQRVHLSVVRAVNE